MKGIFLRFFVLILLLTSSAYAQNRQLTLQEPTPVLSDLQTELRSARLGSSFDVTNYRTEAQLLPSQHLLRADSDITLVPLDPTRSITFELNGSLVVESIEREGKPLNNFVQDRVGTREIGPNVRVDFDEVVPAGQPVTLRFRWSGALVSPEGGPLSSKRLAYVGEEGSYLMYAARWFPFHSYGADRATADITIIVPTGVQVAGASDEPVTPQSGGNTTRFRFVNRKPTLIGNLAAGKYIVRSLRFGSYELRFYAQPSGEKYIEHHTDLIGRALQFYTQQYGTPTFGTNFTIAQIDDASLTAYSGSGIVFLSTKSFEGTLSDEALLREVSIQWWGLTVGLKSFDDAWLSQGLAQWSTYALRETTLTGSTLAEAASDLQKRALRFANLAQIVSIRRAPSSLDDQSAAYESIVFYKGAMVFLKLREILGNEKFNKLLRSYLEQYRGRNASIKDFEELTNKIAGEDMRSFFSKWLEDTGSGDDKKLPTATSAKNDLDAAIAALNRATVNDPRGADAWMQLTSAYLRRASSSPDPAKADADYLNAVRAGEGLMKVRTDADALTLFAQALVSSKQYARAARALETAASGIDAKETTFYLLGLAYSRTKNFPKASAALERAAEMKPDDVNVYRELGYAYEVMRQYAKALAAYQKGLSLVPNDSDFKEAAKRVRPFAK